MLGQQTTILALSFICDIPWWESCNSSWTCCQPALRMMTWLSHSTKPLQTDNLCWHEEKRLNYESTDVRQPHNGSLCIKLLIFNAVRHPVDMCSISSTSSPGTNTSVLGTSTSVLGASTGNWLSASAVVLVGPFLNLMMYSYETSTNAYRWIQPDAMAGTALLCSGLWSVLKINLWPSKIFAKLFHTKN